MYEKGMHLSSLAIVGILAGGAILTLTVVMAVASFAILSKISHNAHVAELKAKGQNGVPHADKGHPPHKG